MSGFYQLICMSTRRYVFSMFIHSNKQAIRFGESLPIIIAIIICFGRCKYFLYTQCYRDVLFSCLYNLSTLISYTKLTWKFIHILDCIVSTFEKKNLISWNSLKSIANDHIQNIYVQNVFLDYVPKQPNGFHYYDEYL